MAWYDSNWTYRVKITVQSSKVGATLTDFPVYVDLSDLPAGFFTNVDSAGDDIRVTESDGTTECAIEVVSINTGSSTGELHFLASSISAVSNTDFYIYYGNAAASAYAVGATYGRNAVWADYDAVYHLNDSDPSVSVVDSTGNGFDLTDTGMSSANSVTGQMGKGVEADTSEYLSYTEGAAAVPETNTFSLQCWANPDTSPGVNWFMFMGDKDAGNEHVGMFADDVQNKLQFFKHQYGAGSYTACFPTSNLGSGWQMFHGVYSSSSLKAYHNGGNKGTAADGGGSIVGKGHDRIAIGALLDSSPAYSAGPFQIDEARIQSREISDGWISTEYNNQNDPVTFFSIGTQETEPTGTYKPKLFFFS